MLGGLAISKIAAAQSTGPFLERARTGQPHRGKVLAAIQPHSDDIALICAGTVAKLINEGYTGYMIRATNDDMGDDVGEPGSVGENVLRNEREVAAQSLALGLKKDFGLNYNNHRMSDISRNELICRLIFLFRFLKVDTVFCYDPGLTMRRIRITTCWAIAWKPRAGWRAAFTIIRSSWPPGWKRAP